jgi:4-aminobutyrate aminotransferase-like enzyme
MERENLPGRAADMGQYAMGKLKDLQKKHSLIGDVRGLGLMVGVELIKDKEKTAAAAEAEAIRDACLQRGLLVGVGGVHANVVRFQPPLVITKQQIDQAVGIFEEALAAVSKPVASGAR